MNQSTKQRIVGTVVLLLLALIFLPIIFDGEGSYEPRLRSRIPSPPQVFVEEQTPTRPTLLNETRPSSEQETATAGAGQGEDAADGTPPVLDSVPAFRREGPGLDEEGLPSGWSVQVAAFADSGNATRLMQDLQAAGYRAYTRRFNGTEGPLTGVYVGPWIDHDRAEEYLARLQRQFESDAMLVVYETEGLERL